MSTERTIEESDLNSLLVSKVIVDPGLISTLTAKPCSVIKELVWSFFAKIDPDLKLLYIFQKSYIMKFDKIPPSRQLNV